MSSKLLMNNNGGGNMQIQKGTVICSGDDSAIDINNLEFTPDIFFIRLISDITKTTHTIGGFWTPTIKIAMRTDSGGIQAGITTDYNYNDQGLNIRTCSLRQINDTAFRLNSMGTYGPTRKGDTFEWIAIKYL